MLPGQKDEQCLLPFQLRLQLKHPLHSAASVQVLPPARYREAKHNVSKIQCQTKTKM